jgi:hypothetical protein
VRSSAVAQNADLHLTATLRPSRCDAGVGAGAAGHARTLRLRAHFFAGVVDVAAPGIMASRMNNAVSRCAAIAGSGFAAAGRDETCRARKVLREVR